MALLACTFALATALTSVMAAAPYRLPTVLLLGAVTVAGLVAALLPLSFDPALRLITQTPERVERFYLTRRHRNTTHVRTTVTFRTADRETCVDVAVQDEAAVVAILKRRLPTATFGFAPTRATPRTGCSVMTGR